MVEGETVMPDIQALRSRIEAHDKFNEAAKEQNSLIGFGFLIGCIVFGACAIWAATKYNGSTNLIVSVVLIFMFALAKSKVFHRVTVMSSATLWELAELSSQCAEFRSVFLQKFNGKEFLTSDDYRMLMSEKAIIDKRNHENQVLSELVHVDNNQEAHK